MLRLLPFSNDFRCDTDAKIILPANFYSLFLFLDRVYHCLLNCFRIRMYVLTYRREGLLSFFLSCVRQINENQTQPATHSAGIDMIDDYI